MVERPFEALRGRRLLVVEDDYDIASDIARVLEDADAVVVGPAGRVEDALELVESEATRLDAASLDINLHDEKVYPVADALAARGVPFVFMTGYDAHVIPEPYAGVLRLEKPVDRTQLARALARILAP
jgi:DNA-binding NtrC family response regulator